MRYCPSPNPPLRLRGPVVGWCRTTLLVIGLVTVPGLYAQDNRSSQKTLDLYKGLGDMGLTVVGLAADTISTTSWKAGPESTNFQKDLSRVAENYKTTLAGERGSVKLLNGSLEVTLIATDVMTEGASIMVTSGVRVAKNKALDALQANLTSDAQATFAHNLSQMSPNDYNALKAKSHDEIKNELDKVDEFRKVRSQLGDDPQAQNLITDEMVTLIKNSSKAQWDVIAKNTQRISDAEDSLARVSSAVSQYASDTAASLENVGQQIGEVQAAIEVANEGVSKLQKDVANNTQQLAAVNGWMFARSTPAEQLRLLRQGYGANVLDDNQRAALLKAAEAQAKADELTHTMQAVVANINSIGQIAQNLGLSSPELNKAIALASTANAVVSAVAGQNPLAAFTALSGMFGSGDPAQSQHAQLMSFLQQNFQRINEKLEALLEGQKKIVNGLNILSQQITQMQEHLDDRLDHIEFKVDTIQMGVEATLALQQIQCDEVKKNIFLGLGIQNEETLNLWDPKQLIRVGAVAISSQVRDCGLHLQTLFGSAVSPKWVGMQPLAHRLSPANPTDDPQDFYKLQYNPTVTLLTQAINDWRMSPSIGLGLLALPVANVSSYWAKKQIFFPGQAGNSKPTANVPGRGCANDTQLSLPLFDMLCGANAQGLAATREDASQVAATVLLGSPLVQERLVDLANLALFFAPLYDHLTSDNTDLPKTREQFVNSAIAIGNGSIPRGAVLLEESLQALTLAVAQADMLYGDMTADAVYSTLWDTKTMKFKTITDSSTVMEKNARELLRHNPYLARNVLMVALDKSWKIPSSDGLLPYEYAFKFLGDSEFEPESEMKKLFMGDWIFKAVWKTKLLSGTASEQAVTDVACGNSHDERTCAKFLYSEVSGVDVPLPSSFDFSRRNFAYPAVLSNLAIERDKVAARVADYKAFRASPNGTSIIDLVRTVVSTYTN